MKKLTTSVLAVVLASSFAMVDAQVRRDSAKTTNIGEVVITGALGIKRKADAVTNAQQVVGSKELTQASAPSAVQSLTGKVSGLTINTTNTAVDPSYRIVLRGNKSITGNNQALVVIDNVISNATVLAQLPPEAIENVNVIKGLQGAALYGQQGVNGVIIVTTKRGTKSNRVQFTLTSSVEASQAFKFPYVQKKYGKGVQDDSFSDVDFGGTNYVAWENTSWGPAYDNSGIGGLLIPSGLPQADNSFIYENFAPVKNHFGKFFQTGTVFQNGLSVNAGGADEYAFLSVNRMENDFVVEDDKMTRNNFLLKAGKKVNKLRIDASVNYTNTIVNKTDSGLYDDILQMPTMNDIRKYRNSGVEGYLTAYATNPYWTIQHARYKTNREYLSGILGLEYEFSPHVSLSYTGNIALTNTRANSFNDGFTPTQVYDNTDTSIDGLTLGDFSSPDVTAYFFERNYKTREYYGDLLLNFDYDLTDKLNLKFNIGNNIQDYYRTRNSLGGTGLIVPGLYNIGNVKNASQPRAMTQQADGDYMYNDLTRYRVVAGFLNADLAFENYLFLNGTFRLEESSMLSTNYDGKLHNKVYPYYSVGLSFVPTKAFNFGGDVLNYLKIAPSFTRVGNTSAVDPYSTDSVLMLPTGYPFGSTTGYIIDRAPTNQAIKPEFVNTLDLNVQFGLFKDRITFEGSIYQSETQDMITNAYVSRASGLSTVRDNVGKMRMRGYELDLGITPIKTQDINWTLKGSFSQSRSKVLELAEGIDEVSLLQYTTPAVGIFAIKGQNFPVIKGSSYVRNDAGQIVVDASGKPSINSTLINLGRVTPDFIMGFSTNFRYKGLTLNAVADWRKGGHFVSFTKSLMAFTGLLEETAAFDRTQGYVIPNSVQLVNGAYVPNTTPVGTPDYSGVTNFFASNTYRSVGENLVVDATAFKVREISLSYDLPSSLLSGTFVNGATFGVFARNPFIIYAKSNRNFADPETSSTTGNGGGIALTSQYPTLRTFGANFKFSF